MIFTPSSRCFYGKAAGLNIPTDLCDQTITVAVVFTNVPCHVACIIITLTRAWVGAERLRIQPTGLRK